MARSTIAVTANLPFVVSLIVVSDYPINVLKYSKYPTELVN
jgi:hypothetical protein